MKILNTKSCKKKLKAASALIFNVAAAKFSKLPTLQSLLQDLWKDGLQETL